MRVPARMGGNRIMAVEIRKSDIIPRPAGLKPGFGLTGTKAEEIGSGKTNPLAQFKDMLATVKEFKKMADEMGIRIPGLPQAAQVQEKAPDDTGDHERPPDGGQNQFLVLLNVVRLKYGDITINELIAVLVQEYGDRKLSTIGGKK